MVASIIENVFVQYDFKIISTPLTHSTLYAMAIIPMFILCHAVVICVHIIYVYVHLEWNVPTEKKQAVVWIFIRNSRESARP